MNSREKFLSVMRMEGAEDHFVSQDCTWENFIYYREKLNKIKL